MEILLIIFSSPEYDVPWASKGDCLKAYLIMKNNCLLFSKIETEVTFNSDHDHCFLIDRDCIQHECFSFFSGFSHVDEDSLLNLISCDFIWSLPCTYIFRRKGRPNHLVTSQKGTHLGKGRSSVHKNIRRHLNNETQECKTGHTKGRALTGGEGK
jgi:hypothetical protein